MWNRMLNRIAVAVVALAVGAVFASPAEAQIPGDQPGAQEVPEIPQEDLETFADIYIDVDEVRQDLEMRMGAADSPEEAQQIQQEANELMTGIVEEHGMTVERYTEITEVLNADPEQHQEFVEILEQRSGLL